MKPKHSPWLFLAAALAVVTSSPRALAQDDTVTISGAEFQRMVYSAHLLTVLDEKPELDASLQVLLEHHRRNPNADPDLPAGVVREATARYRTNAPSYIRTRGSRDEILAAYLEALRQVPARTNFVPANLALLNDFMLQPGDYATASAAELIHAGNHRLLNAEAALAQREELVELCTLRAGANNRFGEALDALLWPETGVLRTDTPVQVLSVNSALSNSPTMQAMLDRSRLSGDGSVTLSTNELKNLFAQEMAAIHEIVNTNLKAHLEILGTQTDLASYLTNSALIEANAQRTSPTPGMPTTISWRLRPVTRDTSTYPTVTLWRCGPTAPSSAGETTPGGRRPAFVMGNGAWFRWAGNTCVAWWRLRPEHITVWRCGPTEQLSAGV